jgi:hypothetical protein
MLLATLRGELLIWNLPISFIESINENLNFMVISSRHVTSSYNEKLNLSVQKHFSSFLYSDRVGQLRKRSSKGWLSDVVKLMVCLSIPVHPVVVEVVINPMKEQSVMVQER